ncbi:MAG: hypothetical protein J6T16_00410 [Opitutales bacterium]|nr:hypothetical protein [Opitutales bacterium]
MRELSQKIRAKLDATGSNKTINEVLESLYRAQSGQTDFDTFKGWKERGYRVEKGAKGFPLWSKPRDRHGSAKDAPDVEKTETADGVEIDLNAGEGEKRKAQMFYVAYIFSAAQVADANGNRPESYKFYAPRALPIPADYKEHLDTIHAPQQEQPADGWTVCEDDDKPAEDNAQNAQEAQVEFVF